MADLVTRLVPDELWVLFRRVVQPTEVKRTQGGGRRRSGDREVLAAIIFVAVSGCAWRQLPPVFGPAWPTVYRRFAQWSQDLVWVRLDRVILDESAGPDGLPWARCAIDAVRVRATRGATERGGVADRCGGPGPERARAGQHPAPGPRFHPEAGGRSMSWEVAGPRPVSRG
ncbi:transposase [Streptomyces sp. NPDC058691]|uniref:transposase n=1 Tax=Streptomyces sp. NPDC058691 TaxID=3346601 RepID=UPI00364DBBFD